MHRLSKTFAIAFLVMSTNVRAASETWTVPNQWGNSSYTRAGDFNGDGKTDIYTPNGNWTALYYSNGVNAFSGAFTKCFPFAPPPLGNPEWVRVGNFDGTGPDEYVSPTGGTAYIYSFNSGINSPPRARTLF